MKRDTHPAAATHTRRGFTLIELLMAIVIIAILIGLLLPAIGSVRERFRVTEVRDEISQLEAAIADFKLKFGHEPPSSLTIYEQWDDGSGGGPGWAFDSQARATIRKLWPKFNFKKKRDINNNVNTDDVYNLKGDQCLVFFLGGGYINGGTASAQFIGFSGNPTDPFLSASASDTTRIGPFFSFDMGRVISSGTAAYTAPLSQFPVYRDPYPNQTSPYLYATSYDGLGYNDTSTYSDVSTAASGNFRIYRTDAKNDTDGNGVIDGNDDDPPAWKPKGFQIISPGPDGLYGTGGPYKPDSSIVLPAFAKIMNPSAPPPWIDTSDPNRAPESDNITNLASGKLDY